MILNTKTRASLKISQNTNLPECLFMTASLLKLFFSGQNYHQWLVMTDQISNLTKHSFPEICRNDQSLNETIWTLKSDKLQMSDMVDELKRKSLLIEYHLRATKFYEAKINPFCMCKLLIKINIVQNIVHSFEKNRFIGFFVLFIRNLCCGEMNYFDRHDWFLFFWEKVNQSNVSK